MKTKKAIERVQSFQFYLILEGALVGVLAGFLVSLFRFVLEYVDDFRAAVIAYGGEGPAGLLCALGLLALCYGVCCVCITWAPDCAGSGIPHLKGELRGMLSVDWAKTIVAKIAGCVCAIGAGLSLGRAGPSIQIGALTGKGFARCLKRANTEEKLLLSAGAGAGLAGAFSAPLAGVMFTLEEVHRNFSMDVLLPAMAASITADFVSSRIFGLAPIFGLVETPALPLAYHLLILPLALLLGAFGVCYNRLTARFQDLYGRIPNNYLRLAIPFVLVIPLAVWYPQVLGGGRKLVELTAGGNYLLGALAVLLLIKLVFFLISSTSGAPGGTFLPLLVLGAVAGGLYLTACDTFFGIGGEYLANFVIYGMVGLFAAVVRAPITGVILITEMSGSFSNFLALNVVALVAYMTADLMGGRPLYDQLLDRLVGVAGPTMEQKEAHKQILTEHEVHLGSPIDGKTLEELALPGGSLVVSIQRGPKRVVPGGATVIRSGDVLTVICRQEDLDATKSRLEEMCQKVAPPVK